ncbi:DUF1289 domain-containing protein [Parvibium lacunae]|uniref:DUF1289 domain-containing protein n=1 Tax=Parvibium lacunae TaxID=1888893 RepID=A0A368L0M1_9BURK|nr:DUF1289 domain-containing protein [Parvibium lacunae]RCS56841.1 DUF1289 domain-containing protein [Parvibium lacunae]
MSSTRPDSPCIGVCSTLYDDVCRGCGRHVMEVANWVFFDAEEKERVWQRISQEGHWPCFERFPRFTHVTSEKDIGG